MGKLPEEKNKISNKSEIKIEEARKAEEIREDMEKKKGESPIKLLFTEKKSEKISPKKAERPQFALMHESKGEKRKEENKKLEKKDDEKKKDEKKVEEKKKVEEDMKKEEKVLEMKSKKIKLEEEVRQKADKLKTKEGSRREQEMAVNENQMNELEKKPVQIKLNKEKVSKVENIEISPEKNKETIVDKLKTENIIKSDTLISEDKIKNKKGSRSSSNSPCRLLNPSRKPCKEKEVSPLDVLMKNVKESDTESDGSLTERSLIKRGRKITTLTKEKIVTGDKSVDSDSDNT